MPIAVLTAVAAMAVGGGSTSTASKQPAAKFTAVPGQWAAFR
ncbi:hypothetical protein [Pseudarthrobacter phenanthrenivorans]